MSSYYVTFNDNHNDDRLSEGVSMYGGKLRLRLFVIAVAAMLGTSTQAAVLTIPQSSLVPSSNYYTNTVGGGIGAPAIMTGGGSSPNIGGSKNDDGFSGTIPLGFSLPYFGHTYSSFYANNNGNISFTAGNSQFTPTGPQGSSEPVISPFFADVDTRAPQSGVMHIRTNIPNEVIVTWNKVGYFGYHADKTDSFQLVLRGPNYPVPQGEGQIGFFYKSMQWETGDASGGSGGFGGTPAAVGFGNGQSSGEVLQGSLQPGISQVVSDHHIWFNQNLTPQQVTAIPNATQAPPGTALTAAGTAYTNPIGKLELLSLSTGQFQAFNPTTHQGVLAAGFDPSKPTYVLIHGWAGPGVTYTNPNQPLGPHIQTLGRDIARRFEQNGKSVNVLAWNWEYDAQTPAVNVSTQTLSPNVVDAFNVNYSASVPRSFIDPEAAKLSRTLKQVLDLAGQAAGGTAYGQGIYIVGHSFGADIAAEATAMQTPACSALPCGPTPFLSDVYLNNIRRVTLLDPPASAATVLVNGTENLTSVVNAISSISNGQIPVDNYISDFSIPYSNTANIHIAGLGNIFQAHGNLLNTWYTNTVLPNQATGLSAQDRQDAANSGFSYDYLSYDYLTGPHVVLLSAGNSYQNNLLTNRPYEISQIVPPPLTTTTPALPTRFQTAVPFPQQSSGWQGYDPSAPGGTGAGSLYLLNNSVYQLTSGSPMWMFTQMTLTPDIAGLSFDLKGINLSYQDMVVAMIDNRVIFGRGGFEIGNGNWISSGFLNTSYFTDGSHVFSLGLITQTAGRQVDLKNFVLYTRTSVPDPGTLALLVIGFIALRVSFSPLCRRSS